MPEKRNLPPLCSYCKNLKLPEHKVCLYHLKKDQNRQRKRREEKLAQGLCVIGSCLNPQAEGKKSCQEHLNFNILRHARWKKRKEKEREAKLTGGVTVSEVRGQVGGL